MRRAIFMLAVLCAAPLLQSSPAAAAAAAAAAAPEAANTSEIEELRNDLKAALGRIEMLEQRLQTFEASSAAGARMLGDGEGAGMRGLGVGGMQPTDSAEADRASTEADRKTPAQTEAVETVARSEQGYVGERFGIEAGLSYSRFSNAQINLSGFLALDSIFLGLISVDEVNADVFTADVTARYGITRRLTLDANVPYIYRRSNFQSGGAGGNAGGLVEQDVTDNGLGDVSFGLSYRILPETFRRPDVVLSARVKAPTGRHPFGVELEEVAGSEGNLLVPQRLSTGSGLWGASVGVSVLKTIDPLVVFGSLTYFRNFAGSFSDIDETVGDQPGDVKVGNAIQFGAGIAFALNERSSLSTSFTQRMVGRARIRRDGQPWQTVVGSQANVGVLNLGATFSLTDRIALIANLGVGMTSDAPDMTFGLRIPYRF